MDMLCPSTMEYVLFVVAHTHFAQEATMVKTVVGRDISFEHEAPASWWVQAELRTQDWI